MLWANIVIDADKASFQKAPEVVNIVSVESLVSYIVSF
jgi:hypothetical protein